MYHLVLNGTDYGEVIATTSSVKQSICFIGNGLIGVSEIIGQCTLCDTNGNVVAAYHSEDYNHQEITNGTWKLMNVRMVTPQEYDVAASTAFAVKLLMADKKPETADEIIQCSALWDAWEAGKHTVDEIFTVDGDPWVVYQSYDNAVYPDIAPGNQAWYTFNKPLHGTTRETARAFLQPQYGTVDIYHTGEWCIFDGKAYKSKRDTNFSPKDYPADWETED